MSTKTNNMENGDNSTEKSYCVTLKPKYQYQTERTKWVTADSVDVRDGLVVFGGSDPSRIFDADEVLEVRHWSG